MDLSSRRKRFVMLRLLPLLALVWVSLPLHHCQSAQAKPACHHVMDNDGIHYSALPRCDDIAKPAPDLRPTIDAGATPLLSLCLFIFYVILSGPLARIGEPLLGPPLIPLYLKNSIFLI